ncbi:MAG: pathogenesis-related family 1 protein [Reichenbachiella sp.]
MKKINLFPLLLFIIISTNCFAQRADKEEIKLLLERHNAYRTEVGLPDLGYSETLASVALKWANELGVKCEFKHSANSFGENLFRGTEGAYTVGDAVDSWGDEKKNYSYGKNKCANNKVCGHYTQIIWKSTTNVGCAKMVCDGMVTWVCNYSPPGNYVGEKPY